MLFYFGKRFIFLAVFSLCLTTQIISAQIITRQENSTAATKISFTPKSIESKNERQQLKQVDEDFIFDREEFSEVDFQPTIKDIRYEFQKAETKKRNFDFDGDLEQLKIELENFGVAADVSEAEPRYKRETAQGRGFNYRGAFAQSLIFLGVQHGYAIGAQAKTRRALKHGAFFRDYVDSVKAIHGWDDGNRFFTNYVAHPMQGALTGHLYVQNSPQALREQFSMSGKYWKTRMKAFLWSAAWSTQFELGPISQSAIGNAGIYGHQAWGDVVVTPTVGTALLISEDALDRYVMQRIERRTKNFYVKIFMRMLLNPTRNFSNILRFREPWYRDRATAR